MFLSIPSRTIPCALALALVFVGARSSPTQEEPAPKEPSRTPATPPAVLVLEVKGLGDVKRPMMGTLRAKERFRGRSAMGFPIRGDGEQQVGPLAPGEWQLQVLCPVPERGFQAVLLSRPVEITADKPNRLVIDFGEGNEVAGRVEGPDGEPLEDVSVTAQPEGREKLEYGALTGSDGRFRLRVPEEGAYKLTAKRWMRRTGPG